MFKENIVKLIEERASINILALFPYGSRVYRTSAPDSDFDYIAITDSNATESGSLGILQFNIDVTIYSAKTFQEKLNEHEISALECLFLPPNLIIKNDLVLEFELSLRKLRAAISAKASNSWVKAKKKFVVDKDYAPYVGLKSLFHCFRILEFGKQIATHGTIKDYGAYNLLWKELTAKPPEQWDWPQLDSQYKNRYNQACSEFRLLAPKE